MPPRMIVAMLVALSLLTACAQKSWKDYNDAGLEAHEQGRYAEAEELYLAALEKAEKFGESSSGPGVPRLRGNLLSLRRHSPLG